MIRDLKPWDRDQQLVDGSEIRLYMYHFCGIRDQNFHAFGIGNQKFGYKNGISDVKYTSFPPCNLWQQAR